MSEEINNFIKKNMIQECSQIANPVFFIEQDSKKLMDMIVHHVARKAADNLKNKDGVFKVFENKKNQTKEIRMKVFCFSETELIDLIEMIIKDEREKNSFESSDIGIPFNEQEDLSVKKENQP